MSTNTFITCSLYTVRRCHTSPGAPDLWARLGCHQGSTQNVVGHARSTGDLSQQGLLPEVYRTACIMRIVLTKMTKYQRTKNPKLCALVAYIAGGTSCHQPMGVGHMTVLQLRGPMGFHVLQWCHPMLVQDKEDKLLHLDDYHI